MKLKAISIIVLGLAVIAAAVSAAVVYTNRTKAEQARADAAASKADAEAAKVRAAEKNAAAEAEKRRAAEAKQKAEADAKETAKLERAKAAEEAKAAADKKAAAEASAKAERAKADAARAARDEAKAKAEAAKAEQAAAKENAAAEEAKAEAEAAKLAMEKLKAEKVIAEAKLMELQKIDFETLARDLTEWKADLEERERALQPEKTIADLSWAGGMEDTIIDADGNVKKQEKVVYDPETDRSIPYESRRLAREERLVREDVAKRSSEVRSAVVGTLESLYRQALAEGRVIDADFYRANLKSLYPDWEFSLESPVEGAKVKEGK